MSTEHQQQSDDRRRPAKGASGRAGRAPAASASKTDRPAGRKYFLGIAIDKYEHWPQLRNARRDVQAICELLLAEYGFEKEDVHLLTDREATYGGVIGVLRKMVSLVSQEDSLLIYYAGHGHFDELTKRGFWIPANAGSRKIEDYLPNSVIKDYLADIPSLHTLLISDSCFSGSLFVRGYQRDEQLTAGELMRLRSRWALCSGRHDETVADGPAEGHSPFAQSILDVLKKSEREHITLDFLLDQVRNQTRSNYDQLPDGGPLSNANHQRGQFVFSRRQVLRKPADELVWEKLQAMPEDTINQLTKKRTAAGDFCDQYKQSEYIAEAIRLGKRLLQKQRFLSLTNDEFDLREYLLLYPDSPYAEEVAKRLAGIKNHNQLQPEVPTAPRSQSGSENPEKTSPTIVSSSSDAGKTTSLPKATGSGAPKTTPKRSNNTSKSPDKPTKIATEVQQYWVQWSLLGVLICALIFAGISYFSDSEDISSASSTQPQEAKTIESGSNVPGYTDASAGTFVLVQGGSFDMGCTPEQQDCYGDEKPVHRVTLGTYYIGQYEVTQAQWRAVMGNNPSRFSGCDQCPVEQVSWNDVQDFIRRLNQRTGQNYRLPTEAEWEFAARGGNNSRGYQYAGSGNLGDVGWYDSNSGSKPHPVGQKRANELGLYDMSGNVREWCQDWFGDYSASAQTNPRGPSTGAYRVSRGGSWSYVPQGCRVARRIDGDPGYRDFDVGFRLARTP